MRFGIRSMKANRLPSARGKAELLMAKPMPPLEERDHGGHKPWYDQGADIGLADVGVGLLGPLAHRAENDGTERRDGNERQDV